MLHLVCTTRIDQDFQEAAKIFRIICVACVWRAVIHSFILGPIVNMPAMVQHSNSSIKIHHKLFLDLIDRVFSSCSFRFDTCNNMHVFQRTNPLYARLASACLSVCSMQCWAGIAASRSTTATAHFQQLRGFDLQERISRFMRAI